MGRGSLGIEAQATTKKPIGIPMKCSHCEYQWTYKGHGKRACCPGCGSTMTVSTHRMDSLKERPKRGAPLAREERERLLDMAAKAQMEAQDATSELVRLQREHEVLIQQYGQLDERYKILDMCYQYAQKGHPIFSGTGATMDTGIEAKLLDAIMKAPAGTDEATNRQLEAAQFMVKKMRSTRGMN